MQKMNWKRVLFRLAVAAFAGLCVALVAYVDFITNYETAISLLYLVPLYLAAWFSWGPVAVLIGMLGGLSDSIITSVVHQSCQAVNVLNSAIQSVFFVVFVYILIALKKAQGRLVQSSRTDPLTGLANSRLFFETGTVEIQRALRYHHPFSLVYMDMDNFKSVNDTLGHEAGDAFLRRIAQTIQATTRKTDTVARIGGDEFAILLPEADAHAAKVMVERVQATLTQIRMPAGKQATFSIGVVTHDGSKSADFVDMVKAADALMYEAKHDGKDTYRMGMFGA